MSRDCVHGLVLLLVLVVVGVERSSLGLGAGDDWGGVEMLLNANFEKL